jgi:hypothetical protein
MAHDIKDIQSRFDSVARESEAGKRTRCARTNARGKAKGGKVARIGAKLEAQISLISFRIERKEARQKARRAKR